MKINEYKCPSCGALLKVNNNTKKIKCEYCGVSSEINDNIIKINITEDQEETLNIIKTLIDDNRYGPATDKLIKLSTTIPADPRVWKYMIFIMTNKLSGDLDPSIPLVNYAIQTKTEKIILEQAVELYKKYEYDEEEKYKIISAYELILERYMHNRNILSQKELNNNINEDEDPLYKEIYDYVITQNNISASIIQRKYRLGYNRAARLIDALEEKGVIGPQNGSKPREVLIHEDIN